MKNLITKKDQLIKSKENLINNLRASETTKEDLKTIKILEDQIKDINLTLKVEEINKENDIKRTFLKDVLNVGLIDPKFITNDKKLNKNLKNQNTKLYQLQEKYNSYFSFGYYQEIKVSFYSKEIHKTIEVYNTFINYDNNKEIKIFESFESACKGNNILFAPITKSEIKKQINNVIKANEKIKKEVEKYEQILKNNKVNFLETQNILKRYDLRLYEYRY